MGRGAVLSSVLGRWADVETMALFSRARSAVGLGPADGIVVRLPLLGLDGLCFLRAVRARLPQCRLVVLSEPAHPARERELSELPVDGYFSEPSRLGPVCDLVKVLLHRDDSSIGHLGPHVWRAIEYMSEHFGEGTTLTTVARAVNVSPGHLAALFASQTGMSVGKWLTRIRIEVTRSLLAETDDKLEAIAEQAGFCDASHLSRMFTATTGLRPSQYRMSRRSAQLGQRLAVAV